MNNKHTTSGKVFRMNPGTLKKLETNFSNKINTDLYKVSSPDLLEETYLFTNEDALKLQFCPWITSNSGLTTYSLRASEMFLKIFFEQHKEELQQINPESFCDLVPLSGSLYYKISEAFYKVFNRALPQAFIGVRRNFRDNHWVADISYRNVDSLPEKPFLIIGDTIATESTLFAILHEIKREVEHIEGIAIFSIASGLPGARLVSKMEKIFGGTPIFLYQTNALFGLMENGTDMPWLHPETITTEAMRKRAIENYGEYLAEKWCTINDWGERCNSSSKYLDTLTETIKRYQTFNIDDLTKRKLNYFLEKTKEEKERILHPLSI